MHIQNKYRLMKTSREEMFSLRVKTDFAKEDLNKITGEAERENIADAMEKI